MCGLILKLTVVNQFVIKNFFIQIEKLLEMARFFNLLKRLIYFESTFKEFSVVEFFSVSSTKTSSAEVRRASAEISTLPLIIQFLNLVRDTFFSAGKAAIFFKIILPNFSEHNRRA